MYPRSPSSLSSFCVTCVASQLDRYGDELEYAPRRIKDELVALAFRRRNALQNAKVLRALLHAATETVYLGNCERVTDEMVAAVRACRGLREFSMKGAAGLVTKGAFANLVVCVPRLRCLTTEECSFVDDDIVRLLVDSCPSLQTLNLKKCAVTNASLKELGRLRLLALNIVGFEVSDAAVDEFIDSPCGESIRELIVTNCSPEASQNLLKKCPRLHTFVNSGYIGPLQLMMVHKNLCDRYPSSYKIFANAPGI